MRIVHASDWHGNWRQLPEAELYVFTGDMLPNFCLHTFQTDRWKRDSLVEWDPNGHLVGLPKQESPGGLYVGRRTDPAREVELQGRWLDQHLEKGGLRRFLGTPGAHVVIVRGNHDFVDIGRYFGGDDDPDVWEVTEDQSRTTEVEGLRIGGVRGINYICGEWSDETHPPDFFTRMEGVPTDLDVLLTHAPPQHILDLEGEHYGVAAIGSWVAQRMFERGPLRFHFFGHVHAAHGVRLEGEILFSNAATTYIVHEL